MLEKIKLEDFQLRLPKNMEHIYKPMTREERAKNEAESFNTASGNLNAEDGYNCNACRNKGLIMRAYEYADGLWTTTSSVCKCMDVRATIKKMNRSGLKNIIRDYTFDKFQAAEPWQQTLKDAARAYAEQPEGWFFIGGQSGAGKTHLCTAICREFLLAGKSVKYMLWRDEIVKLKAKVNDPDYKDMIAQYKNVDVLYVDDLFKTGKAADGSKQKPSGADVNIAFEILNFRYNNPKLFTVISSESTIDDILDIDEATGGRIFERAKAFSLKPDRSKNYRLKGAVEL